MVGTIVICVVIRGAGNGLLAAQLLEEMRCHASEACGFCIRAQALPARLLQGHGGFVALPFQRSWR